MKFEINKVYNKDCLAGIRELPSESIDLVITSPPYYNAREYSQWSSLEEYLEDMRDILIEIKRVMKNHRYIIWNVGDVVSQVGDAKWNTRKLPLGAYFTVMMEEIGLLFIDDYIWDKGEPQSKRGVGRPKYPFYQYPTNVYEHILVFRKSEENREKIACPVCNSLKVVSNSKTSIGVQSWECKNEDCPARSKGGRGKRFSERSILMDESKDDINLIDDETLSLWRRDIVRINPVIKINNKKENTLGHTAPFPKEIPDMAIKYFSRVGDVVLEPFSGSGTTALSCITNSRNYLAFEKDTLYYENSIKRISEFKKEFKGDD